MQFVVPQELATNPQFLRIYADFIEKVDALQQGETASGEAPSKTLEELTLEKIALKFLEMPALPMNSEKVTAAVFEFSKSFIGEDSVTQHPILFSLVKKLCEKPEEKNTEAPLPTHLQEVLCKREHCTRDIRSGYPAREACQSGDFFCEKHAPPPRRDNNHLSMKESLERTKAFQRSEQHNRELLESLPTNFPEVIRDFPDTKDVGSMMNILPVLISMGAFSPQQNSSPESPPRFINILYNTKQ